MRCPELIKITYQTNYVSLGRVENYYVYACVCVDCASSLPYPIEKCN